MAQNPSPSAILNAPPQQVQDAIVTLLVDICQTPAPTFDEARRGEFVASLWQGFGFDPKRDAVGNVTVEVPGGTGPRVLLASHLDTVFKADTDVTVRSEGDRMLAPGIGDNSANLALLSHYLRSLAQLDLPRPRLTLAATVGEEGLGDLYGMRALMEARAKDFDIVIAVDGVLGNVVNASVGSRRHQFDITAKGGHSWSDYPSPSAVHALAAMIQAIGAIDIPSEPRSTYNIGVISGGSSINAIAQDAAFNLDLRSLDESVLTRMEHDALAAVDRVAAEHGVTVHRKQVGSRPGGTVPNERIVAAAVDVLNSLGVTPKIKASSTDANVPMAAGIPSICFGTYRGGDEHRLTEWLEPASLVTGYQALVMLIARLADLD